jgi:hypothetical protein
MRAEKHRVSAALLSAAVCFCAVASPLAAQSVHGKLLANNTDKPIPVAAVTLVGDSTTSAVSVVTTAPDGGFAIEAPAPGVYRIHAEVPGYRTTVTPAIELRTGDQIGVTMHLLPDTAVQLTPVKVTSNNRKANSRAGGFYDRMQRYKMGKFITRDDIEKRKPFRVSDLLMTVPGLQVVPSRWGFGEDVITSSGCRPAVYLDGLRYPLRHESVDDIVNPNDLEGIEVYTNPATVPVELSGPGNSCGAIALWTRGA